MSENLKKRSLENEFWNKIPELRLNFKNLTSDVSTVMGVSFYATKDNFDLELDQKLDYLTTAFKKAYNEGIIKNEIKTQPYLFILEQENCYMILLEVGFNGTEEQKDEYVKQAKEKARIIK